MRRPSSDEVRKLLEPLGFRLTFFLSASRYESLPQANLPAQYHFEDGRGTQVLYLAGRDASDDGSALPPHASRCEARRRYAMSYQRAYKRTLAERARHLF